MRMKKTGNTRFAYRLDKVFWFLLLMLPVISWGLYLFSFTGYDKADTSLISFSSWLTNQFVGTDFSNNIVYTALNSIFGPSGVFPVFRPSFLSFFVYLVNIEIVHIFYDVIVFIPRLAHEWISKAVQND